MNKRIILVAMFLAVLLGLLSFFWVYEVKYMVGRAEISQNSFSVDNSYVFVAPIRAQADGKEKIRVNIVLLNNQGLGVLGKKIAIATVPGLQIEGIQATTDNFGKAIFDVSSIQKGEFYVEISVEGSPMPQKTHLSFY